MKPIRIVFDTNIFISVFVFPGGPPEDVFRGVITGDYKLGSSLAILTEFSNVLHNKFKYQPEKIEDVIRFLEKNITIVHPKKRLNIIQDEPDNRILECAVEFKANYIISGDKHLLKHKKYRNIKITSVSRFLSRYMYSS